MKTAIKGIGCPIRCCMDDWNRIRSLTMKILTRPTASMVLGITACLFTAGCENLTPTQNALLVGGASGAAASSIASAVGAPGWEALAIGTGAAVVTGVATGIIAQHQANETQRRIAEARASEYYTRMVEEKKAVMKKKKVRYIAVDTDNSKETSPQAKKSVMIWDTQSEKIVGNNVYDVQTPPQTGEVGKFDTYNATYIAMGN